MKVRFQADNDLNKAIVKALRRREPSVDFQTAHAAGLDSLADFEVLARASQEGRVLVSHDVNTMAACFQAFVASGRASPGLFLVPQGARISDVVESLLVVWLASEPSDWVGRILWLPL